MLRVQSSQKYGYDTHHATLERANIRARPGGVACACCGELPLSTDDLQGCAAVVLQGSRRSHGGVAQQGLGGEAHESQVEGHHRPDTVRGAGLLH